MSSVAFVLGGGGVLGAHEVGMLQALLERDIRPDLIVGTSIGAINGAVVAGDPSLETVDRLTDLWVSIDRTGTFDSSFFDRAKRLVDSKTHVFDNAAFRNILETAVEQDRIEELAVRFECVAANIESASIRYFTYGPIVDALLASSAVPGLFAPVEIGGEHFFDGGLVASIPLDRALSLGATEIYVLQVGRVEEPLKVPKWPWEVAMVAFEIARRGRFAEALESVPDGIEVHVLPTGEPKAFNDVSQYGFKSRDRIEGRIQRSYEASLKYLDQR